MEVLRSVALLILICNLFTIYKIMGSHSPSSMSAPSTHSDQLNSLEKINQTQEREIAVRRLSTGRLCINKRSHDAFLSKISVRHLTKQIVHSE